MTASSGASDNARASGRRCPGEVRQPRPPSIPSLKDGRIEDRALTNRAIARKRNDYGKALGDILLPEGRTIQQLAREALSNGLRESGYRVLSAGEPGYEDAVPLRAGVHQFWAWRS